MLDRRTAARRLAAATLVGSLALAATPVTSPAQAGVATSAATSAVTVAAKAGRYTPKTGVLTNDPRSANKRRILRHLLRSIRSTKHGESIRIISWNVASPTFVRDLLAANARGVTVRLLMAKDKAEAQPRSGDFWRLHRGLKRKSASRPQHRRSWARTCDGSCRGKRGIAHSKFFVFSKVGRADYVVMSTSANATEVSVNSQWNDMYTLTGNKRIYNGFVEIFQQAKKDQVAKPAYRTFTSKFAEAYFYPWKGHTARGDRVMNELNKVRCRGARGGTGVNGRTRIRIAQDAIINKRGIMIAKKLRTMYQHGCNIKIVFALLGKQARYVLKHTSRGPIPLQQIVADFDDDGVYDRYLHAKVMTVSGVYGKNRSARVAWQGSENWSGLAKLSDEQGFKISRGGAEKVYAAWVDYLFTHPPAALPKSSLARVKAAGVDPYSIIKANL